MVGGALSALLLAATVGGDITTGPFSPDDYTFLGVDVRNGVDGWELVDYDWNPETGFGRFEYERELQNGVIEQYVCVRAQPAGPQHEGWRS